MDKIYKLDAPYPEITECENNPFYVSLLLNLYASAQSELTAVLQYVYQVHYFEPINEQTAADVEEIGLVEMSHIELLAEAIIAFGGTPRYISSRGMYYTTKSVDYTKDYVSMLLSDLNGEKAAIKAYGDSASMVKNAQLKDLLLRIQADEELHYKIFEKLLIDAKSMMV